MSEFDWNRKRTVQIMTPNRVIVEKQMSPKEVIQAGGNRVGFEQVVGSICAVLSELVAQQEATAERINNLHSSMNIPKQVEHETKG